MSVCLSERLFLRSICLMRTILTLLRPCQKKTGRLLCLFTMPTLAVVTLRIHRMRQESAIHLTVTCCLALDHPPRRAGWGRALAETAPAQSRTNPSRTNNTVIMWAHQYLSLLVIHVSVLDMNSCVKSFLP